MARRCFTVNGELEVRDEDGGDGIQIRAVSDEFAKQEAIQILAMGGWNLVNDDGFGDGGRTCVCNEI